MCARTQPQDVRQEGRGAGLSLPEGPQASRAQASGPGNQGVRPGQWEALGKSCYCVFGNPIITVLVVVISVSIAIALGKSVPTCVFYRDLFSKTVLDSLAAWLTLQRTLGVRRGWSPWGNSGDGGREDRHPQGRPAFLSKARTSLLPSLPTVLLLNQHLNR